MLSWASGTMLCMPSSAYFKGSKRARGPSRRDSNKNGESLPCASLEMQWPWLHMWGLLRGRGRKRKNTSISSAGFSEVASAELCEFVHHST